MMTKKDFILIGNAIGFFDCDDYQLLRFANAIKTAYPRFNQDRWISYVQGKCGPNGGKIKCVDQKSKARCSIHLH